MNNPLSWMGEETTPGRLTWFLFSGYLSLLLVIAAAAMWMEDPLVVAEGHLVENGQALLLMAAACLHQFHTLRGRDEWVRMSQTVLSVFCLSMVTREVDIDTLYYAVFTGVVVESSLRILIGGIWALVILNVIRNFPEFWNRRVALAGATGTLLTICGSIIYASSWFMDKGYLIQDPGISVFVEESLQLSGAVFIACGSLLPMRRQAVGGMHGVSRMP